MQFSSIQSCLPPPCMRRITARFRLWRGINTFNTISVISESHPVIGAHACSKCQAQRTPDSRIISSLPLKALAHTDPLQHQIMKRSCQVRNMVGYSMKGVENLLYHDGKPYRLMSEMLRGSPPSLFWSLSFQTTGNRAVHSTVGCPVAEMIHFFP